MATAGGSEFSSTPRRNPNHWQEAPWAFRREFERDPSQFERTPVAFRWWTREEKFSGGLGLAALVWSVLWIVKLVRGRTPGRFVALYQPGALRGSPPFLCFEAFEDAFGRESSGEGEGVLVGEAVPSGTLLLEAAGQVVLPLWNPTSTIRDAPGR